MLNEIIDDRYVIKDKVGGGGFSDVFCVFDNISKKYLAAKILKYEFKSTNDRKFLQFKQEAGTLASLNSRNIVRIYDYGIYKGHPYIIMEYYRGDSLKKIVSDHGPLLIEEFHSYITKVLEAIEECHKKQIIHRDIKADNITVTSDGTIVLLDFGVSFLSDETKNLYDMDESIACTLSHAAPELLKGNPSGNVQTDIYALGITMFELLTGRVPFDSNKKEKNERVVEIYKMHRSTPIPSMKQYNPHVTDDFDNIVAKCCAKKPKARYENVRQIMADIEIAYDNYLKNKSGSVAKKKSGFFARIFRKKKNI